MKKVLSFCFVIAALLNARADVFEYNYTGTINIIGDGHQVVGNLTGIIISDGANQLTIVGWTAATKHFYVHPSTNWHTVTVAGPRSGSYTVMAKSGSGVLTNGYSLDNQMIRGLNSSVKVSTGRRASIPLVMTGNNNRVIAPLGDGAEALELVNQTFTYAGARTVADNDKAYSVDDAAASVAAGLIKKGYIQTP